MNPHGVEINAGLDRDGLHVEYGVMIVELVWSVSEDVKPVSGMYSCDARLDGAHSGRNQVYVGLYTFGGKKRFEYFVCVITKSKCMLISTHYFGGKKIFIIIDFVVLSIVCVSFSFCPLPSLSTLSIPSSLPPSPPNAGDVKVSEFIKFTEVSDLNGPTPQFTLTCISTGGPATTVTWTRDSVSITERTQSVLDDPVTAQYTHTLSVKGRRPGKYTCTVSNNKPSTHSASFTVKGKMNDLGFLLYKHSVTLS